MQSEHLNKLCFHDTVPTHQKMPSNGGAVVDVRIYAKFNIRTKECYAMFSIGILGFIVWSQFSLQKKMYWWLSWVVKPK
jgi:hypothetical protein